MKRTAKRITVDAVETPIFRLGEKLIPFLKENLVKSLGDPTSLEGRVLAITSKIVSLAENRIVPKSEIEKTTLVKREADEYMGEIAYGCHLTIKHGIMIPSAGIDESNAEGDFYILYPEHPFQTALDVRNELASAFGLKNFGVILTDSTVTPLRAGVTGISLAHAGFKGVNNHIGDPDLFGTLLKITTVNVADAIAASAVFCMGESNESCPLALITTEVQFQEASVEVLKKEVSYPMETDLYGPMFQKLGLF